MYKPIALIALMLIFVSSSYSQSSFRPGSITIDGVRTEVLIKYQNWGKNPTSIWYRTRDGQEIMREVTSIQSFDVVRPDGVTEIYERYAVFYDTSPTSLSDLDFSPQPILKRDTVFLMALVIGKISLYSFKDLFAKQHYFIKKEGDTVQELYQKKYYIYKEQYAYRNTDQYKHQLSELMKDEPNVTNEMIMSTDHSSKALIAIVNVYNGNKHSTKCTYHFKSEKRHYDVSIMLGTSSTSLELRSRSNNPDWNNQHFENSTNVSAGAGINFYVPRTRSLLSARAEILYRSYKTNSEGDRYNVTDGWIQTNYKFGFRTIKANIGLLYSFLKTNNFSFYFLPGISFGSNSATVNSWHQRRSFYGFESEDDGVAVPDYRKLEQGYFMSIGGRYRQFGLEARVERTNGFSPYSTLNTKVTSVYALFSYNFIK